MQKLTTRTQIRHLKITCLLHPRAIAMVLLAVLISFGWPVSDSRAEMSQEKRAAIEALIIETDSMKVGTEIGKQMVLGLKPAFKKMIPNITDEALNIIVDEVFISLEIEQHNLMQEYVVIYDRYFSLSEIEDLRAFYRTSTGRKALKTMPQLMQDSVKVAQNISSEVMKDAMPRIAARLEDMGYKVKKQ